MARGREPGLELREDVDTVLAPGMILSMEPMLMVPEVGLSKISTLGGFTFWQKCEFYKVHLICSAYNLSIDGK